MFYRFRFAVLGALVVSLAMGGCNIFGASEKKPGSDSEALQRDLANFLDLNSTNRISSDVLLDVAKESRQASEIGILAITRELSQGSASTNMSFPFDTLSAAERTTKLANLEAMDQALALLLYANMAQQEGVAGKVAADPLSDAYLQLKARNVDLSAAFDACSVYPDFLVVRILRLMMQFRARLDVIGTDVRVVGVTGGYAVQYTGTGTIPRAKAIAVNEAIDWLTNPSNGVLSVQIRTILNPTAAFGCESPLSEIIDLNKVQSYINTVVVASLKRSKFPVTKPAGEDIVVGQ
jgi:hypothetical protein